MFDYLASFVIGAFVALCLITLYGHMLLRKEAKLAKHSECDRGNVVHSTVEELLTTPEARERFEKRLAELEARLREFDATLREFDATLAPPAHYAPPTTVYTQPSTVYVQPSSPPPPTYYAPPPAPYGYRGY